MNEINWWEDSKQRMRVRVGRCIHADDHWLPSGNQAWPDTVGKKVSINECNRLYRRRKVPQGKKFTAIYVDSWMSGSQRQSLTKFHRFEVKANETVLDAMTRENIADQTVFLFHGWPKLQGE